MDPSTWCTASQAPDPRAQDVWLCAAWLGASNGPARDAEGTRGTWGCCSGSHAWRTTHGPRTLGYSPHREAASGLRAGSCWQRAGDRSSRTELLGLSCLWLRLFKSIPMNIWQDEGWHSPSCWPPAQLSPGFRALPLPWPLSSSSILLQQGFANGGSLALGLLAGHTQQRLHKALAVPTYAWLQGERIHGKRLETGLPGHTALNPRCRGWERPFSKGELPSRCAPSPQPGASPVHPQHHCLHACQRRWHAACL